MSQATRRMIAGGVYQPRSRGAAMADALADARRSLARLMRLVIMRGAGVVRCSFRRPPPCIACSPTIPATPA